NWVAKPGIARLFFACAFAAFPSKMEMECCYELVCLPSAGDATVEQELEIRRHLIWTVSMCITRGYWSA
ncbi:MAG: hypothetical protein ACPH56_11435, partial [Spongiibacter marinus]|uniref:hypothetical protein n=1 Tax=Spongiibacter marinus TaxID=354246 RepID=UPI003C495761